MLRELAGVACGYHCHFLWEKGEVVAEDIVATKVLFADLRDEDIGIMLAAEKVWIRLADTAFRAWQASLRN